MKNETILKVKHLHPSMNYLVLQSVHSLFSGSLRSPSSICKKRTIHKHLDCLLKHIRKIVGTNALLSQQHRKKDKRSEKLTKLLKV